MSNDITQVETDVEAIFDYLVESGPFQGPSHQLARKIGIDHGRFQAALGRIRRQTEVNGWTIPFVRRGGFSIQRYAVVPTEGHTLEEMELLMEGTDRHTRTVVSTLDNLRQQAAILKSITAPRTAERKWANQLLSTTSYLVEQGKLLVEDQQERAVAASNGATSA
jgi:hypothetical protein